MATEYFRTGCYANLPLILYGRSLGCLACSYLASVIPNVTCMVLESPVGLFSCFPVPYCFLDKKRKQRLDRLDFSTYLPKVKCPLMCVYGSRDNYSSPASQAVGVRYASHA